MTPTIVTALTGFLLYSGIGGATAPFDPILKQDAVQEPTYPSYTVSMTGYNAVPEQTDSDPFTTASGAFSDTDIMAARSVDLADELPFGTVIAITQSTSTPNCGYVLVSELVGLRVIGDSMHPRKRSQIDILFDQNDTVRAGGKEMNPARVFGMCKEMQITVVGQVDIRHMPRTQKELRTAIGFAVASPLAVR